MLTSILKSFDSVERVGYKVVYGKLRPETLLPGAPLSLSRQQQRVPVSQTSVHDEKLPLEEDSFSVVYCTMFLFLLGCFVLGIIMAVLGVLRWAVVGG